MIEVSFNEKELLKSALDNNQVISFPTETVYGLGALSSNVEAFNNLVNVKNRNPDKPFTLMTYSIKEVENVVVISETARKIINKFTPGSITVLLPIKENVKYYLHLNSPFIGVRIPENKELLEFLEYVKTPLLVPSANKSDDAPALTSDEVKEKFSDEEIAYVVKGECKTSLPSTIIIIENDDIRLVRSGPISIEEIKESLK